MARSTIWPRPVCCGRGWGQGGGPPFLAGCVALAGLVWVGWLFVPALTLAAFLALSVLHFGLGDTEGDRTGIAGVLARGAMPILLPAVSHPAAVAPVLLRPARP